MKFELTFYTNRLKLNQKLSIGFSADQSDAQQKLIDGSGSRTHNDAVNLSNLLF